MTLHDQVAALRAEARRRLDTETDTDAPRGRIVCHGCGGTGWTETDQAGHSTVHPCPICRTTPHQRWADGHYTAGHTCQVCRP